VYHHRYIVQETYYNIHSNGEIPVEVVLQVNPSIEDLQTSDKNFDTIIQSERIVIYIVRYC